MGKISSWLFGLGMGAGLMYFLDPENGNRRKALVRDQVVSLQHKGDQAIEAGVRDLRNRVSGVISNVQSKVSDEDVPDQVLEERVRSQMRSMARHPGAVDIRVENKQVVLEGDALQNEVDKLISGISHIRGIKGVQNNLTTHQQPGNIPQLQGEGLVPGDNSGAGLWSPSTRMLAGLGALYLFLYGGVRGGLIGFLARISSILLGSRVVSNKKLKSLATSEGEPVRVRKTIHINAPVEEVYKMWSKFENFPQFMNNIEEIRDIGNKRSHWVVKGPVGSTIEFDAVMTENVPNEIVAWETTPESKLQQQGNVRFVEERGGTQVNVDMTYSPPAGIAGQAVAKIFGKDPKSEMDADLARLKALLEKGKTTSKNQKITKDQVMPVTGESSQEHPRKEEEHKEGETSEEPQGFDENKGDDRFGGMDEGHVAPGEL